MDWQLAEAKNKFSEVVNRALTEGPQRIRRRDRAVVVIAEEDYLKLVGEKESFTAFLLRAPDMSDLDLSRDRSQMRPVDL